MKLTAYIAGPMSGYPLWNFPAFDACRDGLVELGYTVLSPADLDREIGFDPSTSTVDKEFLELAMARDIEAIMKADLMVMLPGWEKSTGATAEYWLARWRHIPVRVWPSMEDVEDSIIGGTPTYKERYEEVRGEQRKVLEEWVGWWLNRDPYFTTTGLGGTLDGAYAAQTTPYPKTAKPQIQVEPKTSWAKTKPVTENDGRAKALEYTYFGAKLLSQKTPEEEPEKEAFKVSGVKWFWCDGYPGTSGSGVVKTPTGYKWVDTGFRRFGLKDKPQLPEEDILEEALRITKGDRQAQYGPVEQDFARVAKMWSALKGVEFEARDVAMFMICLKLSRETHQRKRDNAVDIAGYARMLHLVNEATK